MLALKYFVSQLVVGEIRQGLPLLWDTDSGRSKMILEFNILFVSYWLEKCAKACGIQIQVGQGQC